MKLKGAGAERSSLAHDSWFVIERRPELVELSRPHPDLCPFDSIAIYIAPAGSDQLVRILLRIGESKARATSEPAFQQTSVVSRRAGNSNGSLAYAEVRYADRVVAVCQPRWRDDKPSQFVLANRGARPTNSGFRLLEYHRRAAPPQFDALVLIHALEPDVETVAQQLAPALPVEATQETIAELLASRRRRLVERR